MQIFFSLLTKISTFTCMKYLYLTVTILAMFLSTIAQIPDSLVLNNELDWDSIDNSYEKKFSHEAKVNLYLAEDMVDKFMNISEITDTQFEQALFKFDRAIELGYVDSYIYFEKAFCEFNTNKYSDAVAHFTKALKLYAPIPQHIIDALKGVTFNNYFIRFDSYTMQENQYEDIEYSIPVQFKITDAIFFRAFAKTFLEDYRGALEDFNNIIPNENINPKYFYYKAVCKFELSDYLGAKTTLNEGIKWNKEDCNLLGLRASCNMNLKLKDSACRDWSKAGELGCKDAYNFIQEHCK